MPLNNITALKKSKKRGNYLVTISGKDYNLSEDLIVKYGLLSGKSITDEELLKVLDENEDESYFSKACNYISFQMRSEYEIEEYLKKFNLNSQKITLIIEKLKKFGYINDEVLAKALLESSINKCKGPNYFSQKVFEKKIQTELKYTDEESTLIKAIEKIQYANTKYPINKQKTLIASKLIRDGFTQTIVYEKIRNMEFVDESNETLEKDIEKLKNKYKLLSDKEAKQKIIASLLRKGYSFDKIKSNIK